MTDKTPNPLNVILEFVQALRDLSPDSKNLKMYEVVVMRCVNGAQGKKKVNPEKILGAFRTFLDVHTSFLETPQNLKLLPKDIVLSYDEKGQISIPLGQIIFANRFSSQNLAGMRYHLIIIGFLTCEEKKDKYKSLIDAMRPQEAGDDEDISLDEKDEEYLKSLPSIPGLDMKELAKVGKKTFSQLEPMQEGGGDMVDKLQEGMNNLFQSDGFRNMVNSFTEKIDEGNMEGMDPDQMQKLMMMGQAMFGGMGGMGGMGGPPNVHAPDPDPTPVPPTKKKTQPKKKK